MNNYSYDEFYPNRPPQYLPHQGMAPQSQNMRQRQSGFSLTSPPQTLTQSQYQQQYQQYQQYQQCQKYQQQQQQLPPPLQQQAQIQQQQQYPNSNSNSIPSLPKQRRKQAPGYYQPNNLSTNSITTVTSHPSPVLSGARSLTSIPSSQSSMPSFSPSVGTKSKKRSRRESISSGSVSASGSNSPIDTAAIRANKAARFAQWFVNWSSNREFCQEKRAAIVRRRSNASQPTFSTTGASGMASGMGSNRGNFELPVVRIQTQSKLDMKSILGNWIHEKARTTIVITGKKGTGKHFLVNTLLQGTFLNSKALFQNFQSWRGKFQQKKDVKIDSDDEVARDIPGNKNTSIFQLTKRFMSSINWDDEKAKLFQLDDDKSFLLPQGAKWLNGTAPHVLRVKFGVVTQATVRFISEEKLRAAIFAFLQRIRDAEDARQNRNFYKEFWMWRLKFIYKGTDLLAALAAVSGARDIPFPEGVACLLGKEIKFQGSGKSADTDRIYVREQLKAIFAAWGPLLEEVEVRAPCSFLDRGDLVLLDSDVPWDEAAQQTQWLADLVGDAGLLVLATGEGDAGEIDDSLCSFVRTTKFPQQYVSAPDRKRAAVVRLLRKGAPGAGRGNEHSHELKRSLEKIFAGLPCTDQMIENIGRLDVSPQEFRSLLQRYKEQSTSTGDFMFHTIFWEPTTTNGSTNDTNDTTNTDMHSTNIPLLIQLSWNAAIYSGCYDSIKSFSESWLRRANDPTTISARALTLNHIQRFSSHGSFPSFTPLSPTLPPASAAATAAASAAAASHDPQQGGAMRARSKSIAVYQSPSRGSVNTTNDADHGVSPAHKLLFTLKMDQLSDSFKEDLNLDGTARGAGPVSTADERGRAITEKVRALAEETKRALLNTPFVLENGGHPSTFAEAVAEAKRNAETLWPGYRQSFFSSVETCRVILSPEFDGECLGADLKKLLCESLVNFSLRIWNETVVRAFQKAEESYIVLSNDAFRACSALLAGEWSRNGGNSSGAADPYETIKLKQLLWQSQESAERVVFGLFERIYARMASVNMRQNCEVSIRNICKQVIRTSLLPQFTPGMTLAQYHATLQSSFGTVPGKCASAIILLFTNTISHAVFSQLDTLAREIEQLVRAFVSVLSRADGSSAGRSPSPASSPQEDLGDADDATADGERITVRLRDMYHARRGSGGAAKARAVLAALQCRRAPTEAEREAFGAMLRCDGVEVAGDAIAHTAAGAAATESLFGTLGHAVYGTEEAAPIAKLLASLELLANPFVFAPLFPGGFEHLQRYVAQRLFSIMKESANGGGGAEDAWKMETEDEENANANENNGSDGDSDMDTEGNDGESAGRDAAVAMLGFATCTNAAIVLYSPYLAKPVVVEPANVSRQGGSIASAMRMAMRGITSADPSSSSSSSSSSSISTNTIPIAFIGGHHSGYRPLDPALFAENAEASISALSTLDGDAGVKKHCDGPVLPSQQSLSSGSQSKGSASSSSSAARVPSGSAVKGSSIKSLSDLCVESIARRISQFPAETPEDLPEDLAGRVLTEVISGKRCDGVDFDVILMRLLQGGGVSALDLTDCSSYVTRQTLITVGRVCPHLTKLSLAGCPDLTSETAAVIVASCPDLEELDLRRCSRICDNLLGLVATSCPRLRSLDVSHCPRITSRGLECLWRCGELEALAVAGCSEVTDAGLAGFARLGSFDATGCGRLTDAALRALTARSAETLRVVRLSSKHITDDAAAALIAAAPGLEVVDFANSPQVGPKALRAALEHGGLSLQKLSFAGCAAITDAAFPQAPQPQSPSQSSLSTLAGAEYRSPTQGLQWGCSSGGAAAATVSSLNLSGTRITDAGLRWISEWCPSVTALNVSGCGDVSDAGLGAAIARLGLTAVNASKCPRVTDAALCDLARRAADGLRQVAFSSDPGVTDLTMNALALYCPNLRELDCSYCHRVGDESVARVVTGCRALEVLVADDCPLVSDKAFAALAAAPCRTSLRVLKASFLPGLTGAGVRSLLGCAGLEYLDVSYCQNVSALDVAELLGKSGLKTLECRGLAEPTAQQQVRLRGLAVAAEAWEGTRLRNANFSWARSGSVNDFFVVLGKMCYRLESVNLSRCDGLTDDTVKQIVGRCPRLKYINLAGCPLVQSATIKFLVLSGIMVSS